MSAITHVLRAQPLAQRDMMYAGAIASLALLTASSLLLSYGSFARMLAAFGLAPVG